MLATSINYMISHHVDPREQQNQIPSIVKCRERQTQVQDKHGSCRIDDSNLRHKDFNEVTLSINFIQFPFSIYYVLFCSNNVIVITGHHISAAYPNYD